jgi:hypothetical protein
MKPSDALQVMLAALREGYPVLLVGGPGTGKTSMTNQAATILERGYLPIYPILADPTDGKGMPAVVNGEARFLPFGDAKQILEAKDPLIVCLDDLGQAPPAVQASFMQWILARRINGSRIPDCVTFVAATNRKEKGMGVSGILEPVKSRFVTIIDIEPDIDDTVAWMQKNGVSIEVIAFCKYKKVSPTSGAYLFEKNAPGIKNSCNPRTLEHLDKLFRLKLPDRVALESYAGACGEAIATEFYGFTKIWQNLPNPDAVLMNPDKAVIPDDIATQIALASTLSARVDTQSMGRFCTYADRLPVEINVFMMTSAISRDDIGLKLQNTRAFTEWTTRHKDVLY